MGKRPAAYATPGLGLLLPCSFVIAAGLALSSSSLAHSSECRWQAKPSVVRIFTLPECGYCSKAKTFMTRKRIPFEEIDMASEDGIRLVNELHLPEAAPVFSYKDRLLMGYREERLIRFLED